MCCVQYSSVCQEGRTKSRCVPRSLSWRRLSAGPPSQTVAQRWNSASCGRDSRSRLATGSYPGLVDPGFRYVHRLPCHHPPHLAGELCAARSGPAQPRKTLQVQGSRDRWLAGFAGLQVTSAGWQDPQGSSVYWIRLISCWLRARWVPDPIRSRISRTRRQLDYHLLALRSPSPDVPAQADFDTGIHRDARGF